MKFPWPTKPFYLLTILILLALGQAGLFYFLGNTPLKTTSTPASNSSSPKTNNKLPIHYSYSLSKNFFEEAYKSKIKKPAFPEKIYGGIVPHHLLAKNYLAKYFEGLSGQNYKKVVLIGPNHYKAGKADIIVSQGKWITPYGDLPPDSKLINSLLKDNIVAAEEDPFITEHSISSLVSFIRRDLGNVKFTPIIIKEKTNKQKVVQLAKTIFKNVDPDETPVLSSVDFSHYLSPEAAEFHDEKSNNVVLNFDFKRIDKIEVDSPLSLLATLQYLKEIKAQKGQLVYHDNPGITNHDYDLAVTTHNFFVFTKGAPLQDTLISMLLFGDLMLDRHVKQQINRQGTEYLIKNLAGPEKRFFRGLDIISANLEGAVTNNGEHYPPQKENDFAFSSNSIKVFRDYNFNFFNLANNHAFDQGTLGLQETKENLEKLGIFYSGSYLPQTNNDTYRIITIANKKIALVGLNYTFGKIKEREVLSLLKNLKKQTDLIVINIHWGKEYASRQNDFQTNLAHKLIDNGADLIIGHHPHVVQGMEIYNNKPIFYSLGNFIFDQYFSPETQQGLAVGINFSHKISIYLFPFVSHLSQVKLMRGEEKIKFLKNILRASVLSKEQSENLLSTISISIPQ